MKNTFTPTQAEAIATEIGLDFADHRFDVEQFRLGLEVELEHGDEDARTSPATTWPPPARSRGLTSTSSATTTPDSLTWKPKRTNTGTTSRRPSRQITGL